MKLKRTQASKPLAKALRALAKALSKSSARNSSLSEPQVNSEESGLVNDTIYEKLETVELQFSLFFFGGGGSSNST